MRIKADRQQSDIIIFLVFLIITTIGFIFQYFPITNKFAVLILDSLGNTGGVITSSFLFFLLVKELNFIKREIIILSVGTGFCIYEFLQIIIPWQTFDIKDIFGTIIGVVIATLINLLTLLLNSNNSNSTI